MRAIRPSSMVNWNANPRTWPLRRRSPRPLGAGHRGAAGTGDLKIYFSVFTGGYSARGVLGRDELVTMDPEREVPLVFACWEKWVRDANICQSLSEIDFLEVHAFGCQPKDAQSSRRPRRRRGRAGDRLRTAYRQAYSSFFAEHLPDNGLPARFTVHVVDVPDTAASYEFYAVGLLQRGARS